MTDNDSNLRRDEISMGKSIPSENSEKQNRYIGPGLGLVLLGVIYFVWYIMPFSFDYLEGKPLAIHNWGYSIIFLTIGLGWYQESILARSIVLVQAFLLPVLASGSFNPFIIVFLIFIVFIIFVVVVAVERKMKIYFFKDRLKKHTWDFLNMHLLILSWLLIMHIGFVFLFQRAPQEIDLLRLGPNAGWLQNYTPELHELSTWFFDISLILWGIIALYERFKMGYNFQKKPWPRWSFYMIFIAIGMGLLGLLIQELTYGFDLQNILDLIGG